jgi:hypothetical protein
MPDGITGWWSNHATAEPKVGSLTEVRFENGGIFKLEIIDLEVGRLGILPGGPEVLP